MTALDVAITPTTLQSTPSHSSNHNVLHGIYNSFFEPVANSILVPATGKVGAGGLVSGAVLAAASSTLVVSDSIAASWVLADFSIIVAAAAADSGAVRAIAFQTAAFANTLIRGVEAHGVRYAAVGQGGTWGIECGVHTAVAGDGLNYNIGIYINSNADFLPAGGARADVGVLVLGTLGWTHPIQVRDTDNLSYLFDVDQYGHVGIGKLAAAGYYLDIVAAVNVDLLSRLATSGTGSVAMVWDSAGGGITMSINAAGNWSLSVNAIAGNVILLNKAAAATNTMVLDTGRVGFGTATLDPNARISIAKLGSGYIDFPTADATDPTGGGGAAIGQLPVVVGGVLRHLAYYA